jgi:uncharacterized protein
MSTLKELQPNVGFILAEAPGYSRVLEIEITVPFSLDESTHLAWLRCRLTLTRNQQGIWADGDFRTETEAECSRCLAPFVLPLRVKLQDMFYYPPGRALNRSDYVIPDNGTMDLVEPLREQLVIGIPLRTLCQSDCKGLCAQCGQNLNLADCGCHAETADPRFAGLLALKQQLEQG